MIFLIFLSIITILIGAVLLLLINSQKQNLGILIGDRIYSDTTSNPGETLQAKSLNLVGRPDHLIKLGKQIIPVEVKTGKTPNFPYPNHKAQLIAYCLLVEENFGVRPQKGILKYPEMEFEIEYTDQEKEDLKKIGRRNFPVKTN